MLVAAVFVVAFITCNTLPLEGKVAQASPVPVVLSALRYCPLLPTAIRAGVSPAVAARLVPAGFPLEAIDGQAYATSCDEFVSAISSQRLAHSSQEELTNHCLSAVRLSASVKCVIYYRIC